MCHAGAWSIGWPLSGDAAWGRPAAPKNGALSRDHEAKQETDINCRVGAIDNRDLANEPPQRMRKKASATDRDRG